LDSGSWQLLDSKGEASDQLPHWFERLNADLRYQLTAIGKPAPGLHVSQELRDGRFRIAGGSAAGRVCWQVSGVRNDEWAASHRIRVEEDKPVTERGSYATPGDKEAQSRRSLRTKELEQLQKPADL
jgi:hypothetical protein